MPRYKLLLAIAPFLIVADNLYADAVKPVVLNENSAVEVAVSDNPNLAEVQERYKALLEVPSQVGTLPDPVVSSNAMNFPPDTSDRYQGPMTQFQALQSTQRRITSLRSGKFFPVETRLPLCGMTCTRWSLTKMAYGHQQLS